MFHRHALPHETVRYPVCQSTDRPWSNSGSQSDRRFGDNRDPGGLFRYDQDWAFYLPSLVGKLLNIHTTSIYGNFAVILTYNTRHDIAQQREFHTDLSAAL